MATFLADLGKRLRTDIADIARASVDPVFSQQLSQARFRREEMEQIREADMREINRKAEIQEAQRQLQAKSAVQYKLVEEALDQGRDTGDFSTLYNLTLSEGLLDEVRGHARTAYQARFGESFDSVIKRQEMQNAVRRLSAQDYANLLRAQELQSREEIAFQRLAFQQAELDYQKAQTTIAENRDITNRLALTESIRSSRGIWSEAEKEGIITSMNGADSKTALKIYQQSWDNYWKKKTLLQKQAEAANRQTKFDQLSGPSQLQEQQAFDFIMEQGEEGGIFEGLIDNLPPEQMDQFTTELASTALKMSRARFDVGIPTTMGEMLGEALDDVKRGFQGQRGGGPMNLLPDEASFSMQRLIEARTAEAIERADFDLYNETDTRLILETVRAQSLQEGDTFTHTFQDGKPRTVKVVPSMLDQ